MCGWVERVGMSAHAVPCLGFRAVEERNQSQENGVALLSLRRGLLGLERTAVENVRSDSDVLGPDPCRRLARSPSARTARPARPVRVGASRLTAARPRPGPRTRDPGSRRRGTPGTSATGNEQNVGGSRSRTPARTGPRRVLHADFVREQPLGRAQSRPSSVACLRMASLSAASTKGTSWSHAPETFSTRPSPGSSRTSRM
jgi:hypothetical protein